MKPNNSKIHHQHHNQVRIIGGALRGRKLTFPNVEGLRPTPDSVRERLFNWLGQDLTGQIVLDLFAGSGALGFESASRHAKRVVMCETHRMAVQNLRQYAQQFGIQERVEICQQDGLQYLLQAAYLFDVVLLDPPFAWNDWATLFTRLHNKLLPHAHVYLEASRLPALPSYLNIIKQGKSGQSQQLLLQYNREE